MATLDDVCEKLEALESELGSIKSELQAIKGHTDKGPWWLREQWWLYVVGAWFFLLASDWYSKAVHSNLRYELQYSVQEADIHRDDAPGKDECSFAASPLGAKFCHYERDVYEEEVRPSQQGGSFVISEDGGKTWHPSTATAPYHRLWVRWIKKEDE